MNSEKNALEWNVVKKMGQKRSRNVMLMSQNHDMLKFQWKL